MTSRAVMTVLVLLAVTTAVVAQDTDMPVTDTPAVVIGKQGALPFQQRINAADKRIVELFSDYLDVKGQVSKNLSAVGIAELQAILQEELQVSLSPSLAKELSDHLVQQSRNSGTGWKQKLSLGKMMKTGTGGHGFTAEGINFDDLKIRFPESQGYNVKYTKSGSISADLWVSSSNKSQPNRFIQTKATNRARLSLDEGLFDAQSFHSNKKLLGGAVFEVSIPADQFNELVSQGIVDGNTFKIIDPDKYTQKLREKALAAYRADAPSKTSNEYRLKQIPRTHGDLGEFNRRVLETTEIRPLSQTYSEIRELEIQKIQMRKEVLHQSARQAYLSSMPSQFRVAANAGIVAAAMTAFGKLYRDGVNADSVEEAFQLATVEGVKVGGATYVAEGIMRKIGDRVLFSTYIDTAAMSVEEINLLATSLPEKTRALFTQHTVGTAFLATFIFDQTGTLVSFSHGELTGEEFLFETGGNVFRSGAVAAVSWGAIVLGAAPGGLVVAAAAIGTHVIIGVVNKAIQSYSARHHISMSDFIGRMPPSLRNRMTPFEGFQKTAEELLSEKRSPLIPRRRSVFEPPRRRSVFELDQ